MQSIEKKNEKLATEPIAKLLLQMSLPTLLAQLVNLLYNIVDRMYVGRIKGSGSLALAGLGVTFPITILVSAFACLIGMGGASRMAIALGDKDNEKAEKILGNCTTMLLILGVVLPLIFLPFQEVILKTFGATEEILPYSSQYITIYLAGTIFVQISFGLNMFITNQGFANISMMTTCIGAILNIILDPILIFGFDLGVRGAAIATIISQAISAIWVLHFLTSKKATLSIKASSMRLSWSILGPVIALGISPFVMQATECLIQLTFNKGMVKYGNVSYVALMSILFSVTQVIWMPLQGFAQGAQPIIGYNYGAKDYERVKKTFGLLFKIAMGFSIIIIAVVEIFPGIFLGMFTDDVALIELGKPAMRIFLLGMSVMGAQSACQQTFLALGEAKISMFLALLRKVILLLPLALILPKLFGLGVWGLFLAEPISDFIAATTTTTLFFLRSRKLFQKDSNVIEMSEK